MLDTNISSYIIKRSRPAFLSRLRPASLSSFCISVITQAELLYGVEISPRREDDGRALGDYLRDITVLDLQESAASHYAQIRAALKRTGTMIGPNDLLIAAHARSLNLTLVSNNTREFSRVDGLLLENWAEPTVE